MKKNPLYATAKTMRVSTLALLISIVVIVAAVGIEHSIRVSADAFYSHALADRSFAARVMVSGRSYVVENGVVDPADGTRGKLSVGTTFDALRLAYALALAERSPIFDIAGTDPDALDKAIAELSDAQQQVAAQQQDPAVRRDVAEYLYPIRFLRQLSAAERARVNFVRSPSLTTMNAYHAAVGAMLYAYATDLADFSAAFARNAPDGNALTLINGAITKQSTIRALVELRRKSMDVERDYRARSLCVSGLFGACDTNEITPVPIQTENATSTASLALARESATLLDRAVESVEGVKNGLVLVGMESSACLANFPSPQYFLYRTAQAQASRSTLSLNYVGDLLSYPLKTPRELPFALYSPTTFYLCPAAGIDISTASSVNAIYTLLDPTTDHSFGSGFVEYERAARRMITALPSDRRAPQQAEEFALMLRDGGAGFDLLVHDIASEQHALALQAANDPDKSGAWNFLVRSAFASLFLVYHHTTAPAVDIYESGGAPGSSYLVKWSDLRSTISTDEVVRDISEFIRMHYAPESAGT